MAEQNLNELSEKVSNLSLSQFKWDKYVSMPTKRVFATPVDVQGSLYVIGIEFL